MGIQEYFTILLCRLFVIPAGILCLAPMKNQLIFDRKRILFRMGAVVLALLPAGAYVDYAFHPSPYIVLGVEIILFFFAYCSCLTATRGQAAAVFTFVCVIMAVVSNLGHAAAALQDPSSGAYNYSVTFGLTSLCLSMLACVLLFHPMKKYISFLIDHMNLWFIWWATIIVSAVFLLLEIFIVPVKYETLYVNRVFTVFWIIHSSVLVLEILLGTLFYYIVKNLLRTAELQLRTNILEMQENAYEKQQRYIEENSRMRHDFKHALRSIRMMVDEKDMDGLNAFLDKYVSSFPEKEILNYCNNYALNATLNYYAAEAASNDTEVDIRIDLPPADKMVLSDTELCSIIGNILENAVHAASNRNDGPRYINLITRVVNEKELYITAANSFDGNVKLRNFNYQTTKKKGRGIGLRSITSIAEAHGGIAEFHHDRCEFYSDILIPLSQPAQ